MLDKNENQFSDDTILQCATDIHSARSEKELIEIWKKTFHAFGFDFLVYNLFSGFGAHEEKPFKKTYVSNIPEDIQDDYFEFASHPFDPMLKYTFSTMDPMWVSDAAELPYFQEKDPARFMKRAFNNVSDGLCVPMIGPSFLKGYMFGGYKKTNEHGRKCVNKRKLTNWHIICLCNLVHSRYCKLRMTNQMRIELTKREMDVLQFVIAGKTNREIGQRLGISVNTVNTYLKNVFLKMNTKDRVTAALKAYSLNLISAPQDIPPNRYSLEAALMD